MERLTRSSFLISILFIFLLTGVIKLVNWVWLRPKKLEKVLKQQGLSGTSYNLFFGDLKSFSSMRSQAIKSPMTSFSHDYFYRFEPFRHQLISKLGKNEYFMWFGPIPMLHISKPELVKEMLTKMLDFQKVKMNPIFDKLFPGLVTYEGEKWAKHRKLINPAFHVEKLKVMLPAFRDSCAEIIKKWELAIDEMGSREVDVWPDIMKLTADVISRAAFGSNYEEGHKIFELLREQTELTLLSFQSVYLPGFRHIPTPRNRRFKYIENQLHDKLRAIIIKRKEAIEAGDAGKDDLLGILMDSNLKEINQSINNKYVGMTLKEVIDECKLFYLAGQETTSTLLVWTLILLSKHQDWQARAREEILQTFGDKVPDFEGLSHLKIVTMILYEVLRLYPPVLQIGRWVHKDTNLGALLVPQGTMVTFFMHSLHQDSEFWGEDALEFNPLRFEDGISKATKGHNSFFPFSWGPRICIGEKFAMAEAKMAISMILQRFSFKLSPSYVHAPITIMFLQPQYGAHLILNKL